MLTNHPPQVSQACHTIVSHMYERGSDMIMKDYEVNGEEMTIVISLMPTSQAQDLREQLERIESSSGTVGQNTPASPCSEDSLTSGLPPWQVSGKKGVS